MFTGKSGSRIVSVIMSVIFGISSFFSFTGYAVARMPESKALSETNEDDIYSINDIAYDKSIPDYRTYAAGMDMKYPGSSIEINAIDYCLYKENDEEKKAVIMSDYENMSGDSIYVSEDGILKYEFTVKDEGFYDISLLYYPVSGKSSEIQRAFLIDDSIPYGELSLTEFSRVWTNSISEQFVDEAGVTLKAWSKDNQGNDIKPSTMEVPEWIYSYVYDSKGYVSDSLKVYLKPGNHTITMISLREPFLLRKIILGPGESVKTYDQVLEEGINERLTDSSSQCIRIEGEMAVKTSSPMLYPKQDQSSPAVYPVSSRYLLNNTIGGTSWQNVGQWIEWEFEVPEDGYYNISLFDKQNFVRGINVSRKIMIDGNVPFKELEEYEFPYSQKWRNDILSEEDGTPFRFYLTEGRHTLRMQVVLGKTSEIISDVQQSVQELNAIYRKVIRITGVAPDRYRDYQITAALPELKSELQKVRNDIDNSINALKAVEKDNTDKTTVLVTMRDQLDELIDDQERFTEVISSYKINVRACGNWITQVIYQPLMIDRIYVYSPDAAPKVKEANWFKRLFFEIGKLFWSFVIDYNQIGNVSEGSDSQVITLWVGTGRDQANVIKNLIDEDFTRKTGINVNVQLVDMTTLLKASMAGEGPDVAIQVGPTQVATSQVAANMVCASNDTPVNYGIRHAVLDLTQFPDYQKVSERFHGSALVPYTYNDAVYALPDTETYLMMFYRKDILNEIGLDVPKTWDDVKVAMTVLNKNQMEFGMLPGEQVFAMILFQQGGNYYTADGTASALDEDNAVNAFKDYCEFYTDYRLDKETSLEERFRTGECPIIIADYTTYNNLCVSAPDIEGLWDFTVVPGVKTYNGEINHATGSIGLADMIMADTDNKEASWEFLKWWTSSETQINFDREMESLMGSSARVATANVEALESMPWPVADYEALKSQLEYVRGIPQVPGGYYTWRNVNNAFYKITTAGTSAADYSSKTPREELMQNVEYINAEIDYKREELGNK